MRPAFLLPLCVLMIMTTDASAQRPARAPASPPSGGVQPYEKNFPTGVDWQIFEMGGKRVTEGLSLRVSDDYRGTGFSGCNTYSAPLYPIRGQRLAMGPIALTKKICDPAHMALERMFLGALHSGPTWDTEGGDLVVKQGSNLLRFRRGL